MTLIKIIALLLFQLVGFISFSSNDDSLQFLNNVKNYAFKATEYYPNKKFYTQWSKEEKPYLYLYVSQPDAVKQPKEFSKPFIFCGTDETIANRETTKLQPKGYTTFCYKTYGNSAALLNKGLVSYSNEAIAFIVFHELIHNYIIHHNIKIPYEFNEALCDVIGNYGTLDYAISTQSVDSIFAMHQIEINEKIYTCINDAILKINQNPSSTKVINANCEKTIHDILKNGNAFQKDRFEYAINTAYLLKNEYYCKHYFLLKQVFFKQKSIKALLEIIEKAPKNGSEWELYLLTFI